MRMQWYRCIGSIAISWRYLEPDLAMSMHQTEDVYIDGPGGSGSIYMPGGGGPIDVPQKTTEDAKIVWQWRWSISNDIGMISAGFLAEVDMRLPELLPTAQPYKMRGDSLSRPFGGSNVLVVGDFWQLDPAQGVFSASLPVDYIRRAR